MKVAIVGGGIGGLTTALLLSRQGHEVTLFERSDRVGGRLRFVEREGYRVDQGPTIVLLPEMLLSILEEGGISRDRIDLIQIDPFYRIRFADGSSLWKWTNPEKMREELQRFAPGEEANFERYRRELKVRYERGKQAFLDRSFLRKRDFFTPKNLQTLARLRAYKSVWGEAGRFFRHPQVRESFSFQSLYIGGNPMRTPALYSLIPFSEHEHGVWYLKGGYAGLAVLLVEELRARGVGIHLRTPIQQVWTEKGRCLGIVREGGCREAFDRVVLNGDFPGSRKLLELGGSRHGKLQKLQRKDFEPSSGCLLLYLGLNQVYRDQPVHQFLFSANFQEMLKDMFEWKVLPSDPSLYAFHPSVIDDTLAPSGHSVLYVLVPVPSAKGAGVEWHGPEQQDFIERVLDRLEHGPFPGLRDTIQWMEVRTPAEAERDGLYGGGSFGIAPTLRQSGVFRPQHAPYGIDGLHAVGASIHPGGGVPIVMQGAKLIAEAIR